MSSRKSGRRLVAARTFAGVCEARTEMEDAYDEALTLDHLARCAGLSRFHFVRAFKAVFGQTPHQYLTQVRIERAKECLRRPSASVTETCFDVGFSSLGSFSALFARRVGRSPLEFHREARRFFQVPGAFQVPFIPMCFVHHFGGATTTGAILEKQAIGARW